MPTGKTRIEGGIDNDLVNQPTMLETQLDSICLQLGKMRSRVRNLPMLDHMTESERQQLDAALERAKTRITELSECIKGSA